MTELEFVERLNVLEDKMFAVIRAAHVLAQCADDDGHFDATHPAYVRNLREKLNDLLET